MEEIHHGRSRGSAKRALLVFPLAALLNSFSMTALLLLFGIAGQSDIAADIGIVQGATLALFYAFSANARNLILADSIGSMAVRLLQTRLWLLLPLSAAAYLLSVNAADASVALALVLILRRASEWFGEIGLASHERKQQLAVPTQAVVAEGATFLLCLLPLFVDWPLAFCAVPWALAPLLATRQARLSLRTVSEHFSLQTLLPHFGSTAIIGTSVFVFRISIVLLVGKVAAGDLFTAFAIGGLIPTIYGQALAPTLAHRFGGRGLPKRLLVIPLGMLLIAAGVSAMAVMQPAWLVALGRTPNFWLAVGISLAGGAVMSVAAAVRTRLLQQDGGENVFGPDLLANVLIATCVPFVFYVMGPNALAGLYGLSGCLSLAFLAGVGWLHKGAESTNSQSVLLGIGLLLLFPVFFQIEGGLFRDTAYVFDAGGSIQKLPLPLSTLVVFAGIALLGNYAAAARTLTTLFFTALLFVMTSLTITQGNNAHESAKLILLAQFLLPMFGLVLGQMYGALSPAPAFERAALWVLLLILPAQLLATWVQGYTLLHPKVFFFSIYQHVQYVPMIIVALLMLISQVLWGLGLKYRVAVGVLLPIAVIYIAASRSWSAMLGVLIILALFATSHLQKTRINRPTVVTLVAAMICAIAFVVLSKTNVDQTRSTQQWHDNPISHLEQAESLAPAGGEKRMTHWHFYANGLVESPRAFFLGHATPPDRLQHPSAHNYWLDALYNFGAISMLPLIILLLATVQWTWRKRRDVLSSPVLLGTTMAALYLVLFENMFKVGMRQPYPGIITFFIWGLLIARLKMPSTVEEKNVSPIV
jgi:hypothetical protein